MHGVMNRLLAMVQALEEANKDILVGKRRLDCLSCSNGRETAPTSRSRMRRKPADLGGSQTTTILTTGNIPQKSLRPQYDDFATTEMTAKHQHHRDNSYGDSYTHRRSKKRMPFGYLVQNERMELHKPVLSSTTKLESVRPSRPESAMAAHTTNSRLMELTLELANEGCL